MKIDAKAFVVIVIALVSALIVNCGGDVGEPASSGASNTPMGTVEANLELRVVSTDFAPDVEPGDGKCEARSGVCTLLAAIEEANASFGHDVVALPEGVFRLGDNSHQNESGAGAALVVRDALTISGAGASTVLDGQGKTGVLMIETGVPVRIGHLVIRNGLSIGNAAGGVWNRGELWLESVTITSGSGSFVGGILNEGGLTLADTTISSNNGGCCGGIRNHGRLDIENSLIEGNGDGQIGWGGGIDNKAGGTVAIRSSTIRGNSARVGGGILNDGGEMTIVDSVISGNAAPIWGGGGVLNDAGGKLTVVNTEFTGNTADTGAAITNRGSLVADNVRVYGNSVTAGGGALASFADTFTLRNSQIYGNRADGGGGAILNGAVFIVEDSSIEDNEAEYGGALAGAGQVTFTRSSIAGNAASSQGGAIHTWESRVNVVDSTLSGNTAGSEGGAIYVGKGSVKVTGSTLSGNTSPACAGLGVDWGERNQTDDQTCAMPRN